MKYFHLTIIRHGETDENKNKIIQGHMETKLSDNGIIQAIETGIYLKDIPIDLIYCSDLKRTCQTATEIAIRNEHIIKNKISPANSIIKSSTVRERSFGVYTGCSVSVWRNELQSREKMSKSWVPPNGESINQVRDRAIHSFAELCQIMLNQQARDVCHPCPVNMKGDTHQCKIFEAGPPTGTGGWCQTYDLASEHTLTDPTPCQPEYLGHLLLMSHGGFINQLVKYLCSFNRTPIGVDNRHIPNCAITQLSVFFSSGTNNKAVAQVDFHSINSTDHLSTDGFTDNV